VDGDLSDPRVRRSSSPRRGAVSPSLLAAKTTELEPSVKATANATLVLQSIVDLERGAPPRQTGRTCNYQVTRGANFPSSSLARKSRVLVNRNGCEPPLNPA